jgi:lipopolysaccharide export system permease protein
MKLVNRYLAKECYLMLLVVSIVLIAVDGTFTLINEMTYFNKSNLESSDVFAFVLWSTPIRFVEYFPIAVLIAVLVTLGRFSSSSELVVLQSLGLSKASILGKVMMPVVIAIIAFLGTMEISIAYFYEKAEAIKPIYLNDNAQGSWHRERNTIFFVDKFSDGEHINHLKSYKLKGNHITQIIDATSAHQAKGGWTLDNAKVVNLGEGLTRFTVDELFWPVKIDASLLANLSANPEKVSVFELLIAINYLSRQRIDTLELEQVLWRRIAAPFLTLLMVFLAAGMIFGNSRQMSTSARVFLGIVIGISLRLVQELVKPAVMIFDLSPWVGAMIPIAIITLLIVFQWLWQNKNQWIVLSSMMREKRTLFKS